MPCTNCAAFGVECRIPEGRQKRGGSVAKPSTTNDKKKTIPSSTENIEDQEENGQYDKSESFADYDKLDNAVPESTSGSPVESTTPTGGDLSSFPSATTNDAHSTSNALLSSQDTIEWQLKQPLRQPGSMSFLGSTSNLNLIFNSAATSNLENNYLSLMSTGAKGTMTRAGEVDKEDFEYLKMKGAFLLPARELCDDIVKAFFDKIHPTLPVINKTKFMRQYNDPTNSPSLLLLQSILVAGSKVCRNPSLFDMNGSSQLATLTFYKRAKALFDTQYETDRIAAIEATLLLGLWNDEPQAALGNVFFWIRMAIIIAQGIGLHREIKDSLIPLVDRRHLRRLWWALFARDRTCATALGRPVIINLDDCDVSMLTLDDFIEDEPDRPSPYEVDKTEALFFIHSVKLSEIMGLVLQQQFSIDAEVSRKMNRAVDATQCDLAMATWINSLPPELKYSIRDRRVHRFLPAYLHLNYYTVLCLLHRSNILHRRNVKDEKVPDYPSWGIAFQAAHMISRILENMSKFHEMADCPSFVVYSCFSAMILLIYQTESNSKQVQIAAQRALAICSSAMEQLAKNWPSAKTVLMLFKALNKDQTLRDTVVKSAKRFTLSEESKGKPADKVMSDIPTESPPNKRQKVASNTTGSALKAAATESKIPTGPSPSSKPWTETRELPAPAMYTSFAPELFLVTNTSPGNQIGVDSFQPSQLFPESTSSVGSSASHSTPRPRNGGGPAEDDNKDLEFSHMVAAYSSSNSDSDELYKQVPNNINIGDWYQFLLETTGDVVFKEDPTSEK